MSNAEQFTCPDCVEGKITAGCAIDKPLISIDCGRCKGTGKVSLPTIELPFSLDDVRNRASNTELPEKIASEIMDHFLMVEIDELPRKREIVDIISRHLVSSAGAPKVNEILCACRTFNVGPARAYLDCCDFLHTTVACPTTKYAPWQPDPKHWEPVVSAPAPSEDGAVAAAREIQQYTFTHDWNDRTLEGIAAIISKHLPATSTVPSAQYEARECFCGTRLEAGLCPNGHDPIREDLVDKVQERMDAVAAAAVDWHEAGQEGGEWFDASERLTQSIERLLEIRTENSKAPALSDKKIGSVPSAGLEEPITTAEREQAIDEWQSRRLARLNGTPSPEPQQCESEGGDEK
jgi:hypothetical protein